MAIKAFVIRYPEDKNDPAYFAEFFLTSDDFDVATLRAILKKLGLPASGEKVELAHRIAIACRDVATRDVVVQGLIARKKGWLALKTGKVKDLPTCFNASDLIVTAGVEDWHGPVCIPDDAEAYWYIKPLFVPHWEISNTSGEPERYTIRWLCFTRVASGVVSLHWRGFSYAETEADLEVRNSQFPYWKYVPELFSEIEELVRSRLRNVNLHDLMIYKLWNKYRYDSVYEWLDRGIRAYSRGISLNARSGAYNPEVEMEGIKGLAKTIRLAVQRELLGRYEINLPEPETIDEIILQTLIQEFGALSYEFRLQTASGTRLFHANSYFVMKPDSASADCFPHLSLRTSWRDDFFQLRFLLDHLDSDSSLHENTGDSSGSKFTQVPLF